MKKSSGDNSHWDCVMVYVRWNFSSSLYYLLLTLLVKHEPNIIYPTNTNNNNNNEDPKCIIQVNTVSEIQLTKIYCNIKLLSFMMVHFEYHKFLRLLYFSITFKNIQMLTLYKTYFPPNIPKFLLFYDIYHIRGMWKQPTFYTHMDM